MGCNGGYVNPLVISSIELFCYVLYFGLQIQLGNYFFSGFLILVYLIAKCTDHVILTGKNFDYKVGTRRCLRRCGS